MGFINFGSRIKHRKFDYIPRYYDQAKEEREELMKRYTGKATDLSDTELAKTRIRAGFKRRYNYKSDATKNQQIRSLAIVLMVAIMLGILILKYIPTLVSWAES